MPERPQPLAVRASVLGGLYLVQGLVYGFGGLVLQPQLAAAGVSVAQWAGLASLAAAPWVLKLAWAPLLDARIGRWLGAARIAAVAMATLAAGFLAIAAVDELRHAVVPLAIAWLVVNVALSLQDVATDALAFDLLRPAERGRGVSVMLGAHHLGADALAGAWIGAVAASRGLGTALVLLSILVVALASLTLVVPRSPPRTRVEVMPAVRALVRDPVGAWALGICALALAADVATSTVTSELLVVRLQWSPADVAERIPMPLLCGSLGGYLTAALVIDRFGHIRIARASTAALGVCWLVFAFAEPLWPRVDLMVAFVVVQAFVTAWLYAGLHVLLFDVTHAELRATQLAVLTAMLNLARLWVPIPAAALLPSLGLAGLFAVCGAFQIALALPLGRLRRRPVDPASAAPG